MSGTVPVRFGISSTAGRDAEDGRRTSGADAYLVAEGRRLSWVDEGQERSERGDGTGVLVAVADGDGGTREEARVAATSACRVLAKLWQAPAPEAPGRALADFLVRAHTRMHWKSRGRGVRLSASLAVAWLVGDRLAWATVGSARVLRFRDGVLQRLGTDDVLLDRQRFLAGSVELGDDTAVHLLADRNAGEVSVRAGDQVVVATDGLLRVLDPTSIAVVLAHVDEPQTAATTLLERAVARGAQDAVTVAVLDLRG